MHQIRQKKYFYRFLTGIGVGLNVCQGVFYSVRTTKYPRGRYECFHVAVQLSGK